MNLRPCNGKCVNCPWYHEEVCPRWRQVNSLDAAYLKSAEPRSLETNKHKAVLKRHKNCAYCDRPLGWGWRQLRPTVDHVVPRYYGGSNNRKNLVPACLSCNQKKRNLVLVEFCDKYGLDLKLVCARIRKATGGHCGHCD